jgi:hypothetical protein
LLVGILVAALTLAAHAQALPTTRDWRTWPFSDRSPWNHPIGSGATFAPVAQLASYPASINHDGRWTVAVYVATAQDPEVTMLLGPAWGTQSLWSYLDRGGRNCHLSATTEQALLRNAAPTLAFDGNYYSTIATPDDSRWLLPPRYQKARDAFRGTFRMPVGACPSPDSDSFMAVFQPDGWVIDIFATVVTSRGSVLGTMASTIDAHGDGTGWWNGRRASMLPSFAGLIRAGELATGRIPHALAVQVPARLLTEQAVWPAYAFDRNAGYSGLLPMGTLLAIPAAIDIERLGLSTAGKVIARAAQDYGVYIVDRGGSGINFMAELGDPDIRWERSTEPAWWQDIETIKNLLQRVTNNGPSSVGGGGTPRAPFAPPFAALQPPAAPRLLSVE